MDGDELAYYRAVEDHFAALRGTPLLFTPKDFAWLERWRRGGIPLAAVLAGVSEVYERKMQEDGEPVSSLAYCRHSVLRHARRLAAARAGGIGAAPDIDVAAALARLVGGLAAAVDAAPESHPARAVIRDLAMAVAALPADGDPAGVDEALSRLEVASLEALFAALPEVERKAIDEKIFADLAGVTFRAETVRRRTIRALRLKHLRAAAGLPRLELDADAS